MKLPKSENVLIVLTTLTSIGGVMFKGQSNIVSLIGIVSAVAATAVFAFYQTSMSAEISGWRTKAFWGSLITVLGSVALALSEMELPGVGAKVSQIAGLVAAAVVTAGYTIHRYQVKTKI